MPGPADIVGGIIIIGTAAYAGGILLWDIFFAEGTADKDWRLRGDPGTINKDGNKETKIGPDGRATQERHNTDHGRPWDHTNPHDHDIDWTPEGNPDFGKQTNYPNGAPPFK
jgi:hypothetical protein